MQIIKIAVSNRNCHIFAVFYIVIHLIPIKKQSKFDFPSTSRFSCLLQKLK